MKLKDVSVGQHHLCVLDAGGKAYCSGANEFGQLGTGILGGTWPLAPVQTTMTFKSFLQYSDSDLVCAWTTGDQVACWGRLSLDRAESTPVLIDGGAKLSAASKHSENECVVRAAGKAYCWGENSYAQVGDGTINPAPSATPLATTETVADIAFGSAYTGCFVSDRGRLYCWGNLKRNVNLNLPKSPVPVEIPSPAPLARLAHGGPAHCALAADGAAYCWGDNGEGQLGDGTRTASSTPVPIAGGLRFKKVVIGWWQVCGIATDGVGYCWGPNTAGQGGNGTQEDALVPTRILDRS